MAATGEKITTWLRNALPSRRNRNNSQSLPFKYTPLVARDAIRLLRILPGDRKDPIYCTLFESDPEHSEDYQWVAISYVWGSSKLCRQIFVNNRILHTTQSCFEVLLNMRQPDEEVVIWIDAVCINQQDNTEKGHQVQRMSAIYSGALSVVVWLGEFDRPGLHEACQFLEAVEHRLRDGRLTEDSSVQQFLAATPATSRSENLLCVEEIFTNPWMRRLWVVQEAVLARSITFRWGQYRLSWKVVYFVYTILLRGLADTIVRDSPRPLYFNAFGPVAFLRRYLAVVAAEGLKVHLSNILSYYHERYASDPRDFVYGVLGLLRPTKIDAWKIDYTQSVERTYSDATRYCINNEGTLNILGLVGHPAPRSSNIRLQSWVPDFCQIPNVTPLAMTRDLFCNAGGDTKLHIIIDPDAEYDDAELHLEGLLVDKINLPAQRFDDYYLGGTFKSRHLLAWCQDVPNTSKRAGIPSEAAVWRTLLAGGFYNDGFYIDLVEQNDLIKARTLLKRFLVEQARSQREVVDDLWLNLSQHQRFSDEEKGLLRHFIVTITDTGIGRRFAITQLREPAMVPKRSKRGDLICILPGGRVPYVIRPASKYGRDRYEFIGEAYIDSLMQGEGMRMGKKMQPIILV